MGYHMTQPLYSLTPKHDHCCCSTAGWEKPCKLMTVKSLNDFSPVFPLEKHEAVQEFVSAIRSISYQCSKFFITLSSASPRPSPPRHKGCLDVRCAEPTRCECPSYEAAPSPRVGQLTGPHRKPIALRFSYSERVQDGVGFITIKSHRSQVLGGDESADMAYVLSPSLILRQMANT